MRQTPSRKFLPLAYQIASRLGGSQGGDLSDSGFQVRRLAEPIPHILYSEPLCRNYLLEISCWGVWQRPSLTCSDTYIYPSADLPDTLTRMQ